MTLAYGNFNTAGAPMIASGTAIRTPYGTLLPANTRVVAYVRADGVQDGMDEFVRSNLLVSSLKDAASRCVNPGDTIVVLPGHTENVDAADWLSNLTASGARIIGMGQGGDRPTLTWTVAAATLLFDQDNMLLENFILKLADAGNGGVTVAAPITVSADGCTISNCDIRWGDDANDIVGVGIAVTGDDFTLVNSYCVAAAGAAPSNTFMTLNGCARPKIMNCHIEGETSGASIGPIRFITAASTNIYMENCSVVNLTSSADQAVTGIASNTGFVKACDWGLGDGATLAAWGTPASVRFSHCKTVNAVAENGADMTTVSDTSP